ncbi:hypothetical protein [Paenibacillus puerhi]|uniref:hypothetical protein n=1 Tax=Paenibacillus puerhi TaxID=2692622 RepID=UPI0013587F62|nr:hypothetical protein [Paenibacillus puerhi]
MLTRVLILTILFISLLGCDLPKSNGNQYSLIVKWHEHEYEYEGKDTTEDKIDKKIGSLKQTDISIINCKECPPSIINDGSKVFTIKGVSESEKIVVEADGRYYLFKQK